MIAQYGGSISGEHGDGQSKAALLPKMFGEDLVRAFGEFKAIWDPDNKMNPHKVVDPYLPGENLRLGPHYHPPQVETHFKFPDDHGSFAYATERCVGVGQCRKDDTGTMCPSYMVTREDMHSTRGRAHLLFEMLEGDPMKGGWKSEPVKEALDLCLACKACRSECPMNVDMATYKAEFLAHYYEGRLRPRHAYAMGLIYWWARLASLAPGRREPDHAPAGRRQGRPVARRDLDPADDALLRPRDLQGLVASAGAPRNVGLPRVLLWADTFNNHFHPQTAIAAVEVLEAAGFQVVVPRQSLCCGRPLYDFGMLAHGQGAAGARSSTRSGPRSRRARRSSASSRAAWRRSATSWSTSTRWTRTRSGCRTTRSSSASSSSRKCPSSSRRGSRRKAIVQKHCHHDHVMGYKEENDLLQKLGLDFEMLDSGCCGMAGSFGFEADHYDVSVQGRRADAPAERSARPSAETLVIADGFSCREQIADLTGRGGLHVAQVVQMALRGEVQPQARPARGVGLRGPGQVGAGALGRPQWPWSRGWACWRASGSRGP